MGICCGSNEKYKVLNEIKSDIVMKYVVVYSKVGCPKSLKVKSLLYSIRADPRITEISSITMKNALKDFTHQKSSPYVFIGGKFISNRKFEEEIKKGEIQGMIKNYESNQRTNTCDSI